MDPAGNTYDSGANAMTVGNVDPCLASPEAIAGTHAHTAHVVIENSEDLIGWQARLNYDGSAMRLATANFAPFTDSTTNQAISFVNLPKDDATNVHRDIVGATSDLLPSVNSALIGSAYVGTQTDRISPDTPAKAPPDDTSYSAPNGGVLAALELQVVGDQGGRTMFMQLDDNNPNPPGSRVVVFNGSGTTDLDLSSDALSGGYHAEGADGCSPVPTPTDAPVTPTPPAPSPGPEEVADLWVTAFDISAPESVQAGQAFDVMVGVEIGNEGPVTTPLVLSTNFYVAKADDCIRLDNYANVVELGDIQANSVRHYDASRRFACSGASGEGSPVTIDVTIHVSGWSPDPNGDANFWYGQLSINVMGTGPLPTPTLTPMSTPDDFYGVDPAPVPIPDRQEPSSAGGATGAVAVQSVAPVPAQGVLAAALPATGRTGDGGFPDWGYLLLLGGTVVLPVAVALALGRFRSLRPR